MPLLISGRRQHLVKADGTMVDQASRHAAGRRRSAATSLCRSTLRRMRRGAMGDPAEGAGRPTGNGNSALGDRPAAAVDQRPVCHASSAPDRGSRPLRQHIALAIRADAETALAARLAGIQTGPFVPIRQARTRQLARQVADALWAGDRCRGAGPSRNDTFAAGRRGNRRRRLLDLVVRPAGPPTIGSVAPGSVGAGSALRGKRLLAVPPGEASDAPAWTGAPADAVPTRHRSYPDHCIFCGPTHALTCDAVMPCPLTDAPPS